MNDGVPDLLVVGGGLVGLCAAEAALRRGLRVTVLERERVGSRASWAGSGMLNCRPWPRTEEHDYHDLALASLELHRRWHARLLEETGIDGGYVRCGALELCLAENAGEAALANLERMVEGCRARGLRAERLSSERARELEPELDASRIAAAVHLPDDGQVRNPRLARALAASCRQRGALIREGVAVTELWIEGDRARGAVDSDGKRYAARHVVVCAGAWTGRFEDLARRVPRAGRIEPVRGQIACFQVEPGRCTRLLTTGEHYLVPRPDGLILAGSTMERVGFETVTTPEGQAELRDFARRLLPFLRHVEPAQGWADVRPGLRGVHPLLGPVPDVEGLYVAAGHFRNGILLAPISGEVVAALVAGEPPPVEIGPWMPRKAVASNL